MYLPKGTIIGLKHSMHQKGKTVVWRDQIYDPVESYRNNGPSPPGFTARNGGDLGAPEGKGFYWFEKWTGPYFFKPSKNPPGQVIYGTGAFCC